MINFSMEDFMFTKARWIWYESLAKADSYGEFYDTFL